MARKRPQTVWCKSGSEFKAIAIAQTRLKRANGSAKTPPAMVARMNEDINKVLAMPDVQEKMEQYGAEDGGGGTEEFPNFIKAEQVKWAQVAKDAKVRADA